MDMALSAQVIAKRKRKTLLIAGTLMLLLLLAIWSLRTSLQSSIKQSAFTTAVVEKGDIENTITASGEILPEFEETITSPINASIQKVILDAGSRVKAGQSVLTLDKSTSQTEYTKLKFQLESKRNDIKKLRLQLDKSFYDIQSNNDIKQLRINSLDADVENAKRLFKAGGGTKEDVSQAELNLKVAQLEKRQLENEIKSKQQTMQTEMKEAEIAASIQENDLNELGRKLQLANIVSSRGGVVTWVNENIGASIREGDALARIADLGSFKVHGSLSDNYLDQLHNDMTAIIRINDTQIRGTVINIQPSVHNGIVSFDIQLNERNNKLFRPNMKVDVFLVTSTHSNVLRVANGPAFKGSPTQDIFIVGNGKARRRTVHIGMMSFDYVEIKDNVRPGDLIITSDMSEYKNSQEIIITN
ncbi:HlyD family efflux transporter periplasmic adaptor subunit [Flavitalea sp. BT771]|uniref:efflux RND transporter periplasmic adaptor subunit n=1 Tax=Flavitalea sp. BT771 TaxID=3063329 RepID=UPI0026E3BF01|nr:HlyD family efflux transporter periplasmic adaptor subunit [Flavitalea sp. BT771]MDO6431951.1 HlyD family efflux transporter periplasmic adaptor subunit [Flavitalea sp. BT771]MDV6220860.1 HlyD family efflux transporter periplasmic adaptor subunit [Flavitalea sp. BT771]